MSPLPPLLVRGDAFEELRRIPDGSVDSIVTDPPYGIDFMGRDWDNAVKLANGMLGQIAKGEGRHEGGGPLAKGGTHSQGYANHDGLAFELWTTRWAAECMRILAPGGHLLAFGGSRTWHRLAAGIEDAGFEMRDSIAWLYGSGFPKSHDVSKAIDKAAGAAVDVRPRFNTAGDVGAGNARDGYADHVPHSAATDAAKAWEGWGTGLKPAFEPIVVARKPLIGTVARNVLAYGTGALNIDGARIGTDEDTARKPSLVRDDTAAGFGVGAAMGGTGSPLGRWPANVILDESQAAELDRQSGDAGGASRFFYVAKAPKRERPFVDGVAHPTVKPLALMRYLCRLVTPPGGLIVDPFAGSGTTLEAAYLEGFESIGIEMTPEFWPLVDFRIARALSASTENRDAA